MGESGRGGVAGRRRGRGWRRAAGVAVGIAFVCTAGCSGGGKDEGSGGHDRGDGGSLSDPALVQACDAYEAYLTLNQTFQQAPVPQDFGRLLEPIEDVQPPPRIAPEWEAWVEALESYVASLADPPVSTPELEPDPAIQDMWTQDCAAEGGYDMLPDDGLDREDDPDELPPYESPRDGGELRVAEQGFSSLDDRRGDPEPMVSYGVVVENTSDQVAAGVEVTVGLVDPAGQPITDIVEGEATRTFTIPVLFPHQRFGVGTTSYVERPGVAGLEVGFESGTEWWPADHELIEFPEVTTSDVTTAHEADDTYTVSFTIDSPYPFAWMRTTNQVYAVLRNGAGEIVGGAHDFLSGGVVAAGTSAGRIHSGYPVPEVDDARTEVYV